jgi:multidrug resistance protein
MFAPAIPQVMMEFHNSSLIYATWVLSIYVLGYACGPLVVGPLSEVYGRVPVYHVCHTLFLVFVIACAVADTLPMLTGFRFLAGLAGSGPITLGAGTVGDMIRPQHRGIAIAAWSVGPLLGPAVGPVAGGFLAAAKGWRWVFWVISIAVSVYT